MTKFGAAPVGEIFAGVKGAGTTLPQGEQEIINFIEGPVFTASHPTATKQPHISYYHGNTGQYIQDWAKSEMERNDVVIAELQQEILRRGCKCK